MIATRTISLQPYDPLSLVVTLVAARTLLLAESRTTHGKDSAAQDLTDIRRCLNGDRDCYQRLIERHQQRIAALMWRFSREPATHEELVQDVFVEAYLSLGSYRARAPFEHWLARIATRVGYRFWRRQARERATSPLAIEEWDRILQPAGADTAPKEAAELLNRLLMQLKPRDRLVLTLRYLEELSVAETAQRLGWSQALVKIQSLRARRRLKALVHHTHVEIGR